MKKILSILILTLVLVTGVTFADSTFYKNGQWITHTQDCQNYFNDPNMIGWAGSVEGTSTCSCKDGYVLNSDSSKCIQAGASVVSTPTQENESGYQVNDNNENLGGGHQCSADLILHQNLRAPRYGYVRDGYYDWYTKGIVTEAHILQEHLNRLGFNAGPVDGIIGPKTRGAILRLQNYLGTKADGYVGPITRRLINYSCSSGDNSNNSSNNNSDEEDNNSSNNNSNEEDNNLNDHQDCVVNGITVEDSTSHEFYSLTSVSAGDNCDDYKITRTCSNGVLSGGSAYIYDSCNVEENNSSNDSSNNNSSDDNTGETNLNDSNDDNSSDDNTGETNLNDSNDDNTSSSSSDNSYNDGVLTISNIENARIVDNSEYNVKFLEFDSIINTSNDCDDLYSKLPISDYRIYVDDWRVYRLTYANTDISSTTEGCKITFKLSTKNLNHYFAPGSHTVKLYYVEGGFTNGLDFNLTSESDSSIQLVSTDMELNCDDSSEEAGWYRKFGRCGEDSGISHWKNVDTTFDVFVDTYLNYCQDHFNTKDIWECDNKLLCQPGFVYVNNTDKCVKY